MTIARMNYVARDRGRPRYYANDHSKDRVVIAANEVQLIDGRMQPTSLDTHGFELIHHVSGVTDFRDPVALGKQYRNEIQQLVIARTGAKHVSVSGPGIVRYSERSNLAGTLNNSMPARFAHVDISDSTAEQFAKRSAPEWDYSRCAAFNLWRVFTPPPQDVPLAVCDARTVSSDDLILSDAIFDEPDGSEWSFESLTVACNPAHQWYWFSDMTRDELIMFVTNDSDHSRPHSVPHCAFDCPLTAAAAAPRGSIEMRVTCYWD